MILDVDHADDAATAPLLQADDLAQIGLPSIPASLSRGDWRRLRRDPGLLCLSEFAPSAQPHLVARFALAENHDRRENDDRAVTLVVTRNDRHMASWARALGFFSQRVAIVRFPAWDCQPYDRISPHSRVSGRRMATLAWLRRRSRRPLIVLTTVNALLQRVPPRAVLDRASYELCAGQRDDFAALIAFFERWGFRRVGNVAERGDYTVRGGLIDVFPTLSAYPLRLDFFADRLESIRRFDPETQRSRDHVRRALLTPSCEVPLDPDTINHFRDAYSIAFGVARNDRLYEAVSSGQRYPGMEQFLPLFYQRLETLFDYLPGSAIFFDAAMQGALTSRYDEIVDLYQQRRDDSSITKTDRSAAFLQPLEPDHLYLSPSDCAERLKPHRQRSMTTLRQPDTMATIAIGAILAAPFYRHALGMMGSSEAPSTIRQFADFFTPFTASGRRCVIAVAAPMGRDRLHRALADYGLIGTDLDSWNEVATLAADRVGVVLLEMESGFVTSHLGFFCDHEILAEGLRPTRHRRRGSDRLLLEMSTLSAGDLVVHRDHGIGRFTGLRTIVIDRAARDCLDIVYAGDSRLIVPVENGDMLTRYGAGKDDVQLDRLGAAGWQNRKSRLKKRLRDMAAELMQIAAARALASGIVIEAPEERYRHFCDRFAFEETEDQANAILAVTEDIKSGRPMDRLICGDVGFGKTEIALRAACLCALSGQQVAVIAPTTLLARQHYHVFCERFEGFGVSVAMLSRLTDTATARRVREDMKTGAVMVVIGTHALLAADIAFNALGLVVIDEEQHFGVRHKERLKKMRQAAHILTLTATPIPRTLQMAMSGVRDLSLIRSPPPDRLAVRSFVMPFDPVTLRQALMREHARNGKSFIVCPRISDIPAIEDFISTAVPELESGIAHGAMRSSRVETVMEDFYSGKRYDILIATTIIEAGLDIPHADTLIIIHAHKFGLAQLYQLRGRVGRGNRRGYAYLTYPGDRVLSERAEKRLEILQSLDDLGSGFSLAAYDLDLRGAGNLLGEEQSGHVREVGVELYQQMLAEAVREIKVDDTDHDEQPAPSLNFGIDMLIPESYVADLPIRLGLYRRLSILSDAAACDDFKAELRDRFGPPPVAVDNLLAIVALKAVCLRATIIRIDVSAKGAVIAFYKDTHPQPEKLLQLLLHHADTLRLRSDHRLVLRADLADTTTRLQIIAAWVEKLAAVATAEEPS